MLRTACEPRCALGARAVLLKGWHLQCGSVCLVDVVSASVEAGAAVGRIHGVGEKMELRYGEIAELR